mgnify:CR=1 FL=1
MAKLNENFFNLFKILLDQNNSIRDKKEKYTALANIALESIKEFKKVKIDNLR